jgi:hypothetical protein
MRRKIQNRANAGRSKRSKVKRSRADNGNVLPPVSKPIRIQKILMDQWLPSKDFIVGTSLAGSVTLAIPFSGVEVLRSPALFSMFDEYRVLGAVVIITPIQVNSAGVTRVYWDDDDSLVPTGITAEQHFSAQFSNCNAIGLRVVVQGQEYQGYVYRWSANNLAELIWENTGATPPIVVSFKMYTDATLGSQPSTTLFLVRCMTRIQFRGMQ